MCKRRSSGHYRALAPWLLGVVIVILVLLRLVHLGADTPSDYVVLERDRGLYVDEGYKTLSARNMVTFGRERWHPDDAYPGWLSDSPITQGVLYLLFSALGPSLETARLAAVICFSVLLLIFAAVFYRKIPGPAFWTGLLLIGCQPVIWTFSRVALFEIVSILLVFGTLLILRHRRASTATSACVLLTVGAVAAFGVKLNAVYIVLPALFGLVLSGDVECSERRLFWKAVLIGGVCLIPVIVVKLGYELPLGLTSAVLKADLFPLAQMVEKYFANSNVRADPFLVSVAHVSLLGLLLHRAGTFAGNPYRCAVTSIALIGTGILAIMGEVPLRYCVLILPSYILLIVEWWCERAAPEPQRASASVRSRLGVVVAFVVLTLVVFDCMFLLSIGLSRDLGAPATDEWPILGLVAAAIVVAFGLWGHRDRLLSERVVSRLATVVLCAGIVFNGYKVSERLLAPTWQVQTIGTELAGILPPDAVVAGDWSPLFALGTDLRVLYTDSRVNSPERFHVLRPSHFLYCQTEYPSGDDGMRVKNMLKETAGVVVGEPLYRSEYTGLKVILYPIVYSGSTQQLDGLSTAFGITPVRHED